MEPNRVLIAKLVRLRTHWEGAMYQRSLGYDNKETLADLYMALDEETAKHISSLSQDKKFVAFVDAWLVDRFSMLQVQSVTGEEVPQNDDSEDDL